MARPRLGELSGAFGDLGTVLPLAAGLVLVNGVDPAAFFVAFGAATLVSGLAFRGWLPRLKGTTPAELLTRIPQRIFGPVRAA